MILPPPRTEPKTRATIRPALETEHEIPPIRVLERLPLAEAVLGLFGFVFEPNFLDEVFQRYRGRSSTKKIDFPAIVHLIGHAITRHGTIYVDRTVASQA